MSDARQRVDAAGPARDRAPMGWGGWVLLVLLVGAHGAVLLAWIAADGRASAGLYPEHIWPLVDAVGALDPRSPPSHLADTWLRTHGWLSWLAAGVFHLSGGHPDSPLWVVAAFALGAQVLIFQLGRRLGGTGTGLLAAALLPLLPMVALATRRWGIHGPQLALVLAGAHLALASRGFTRWRPTLGFVGVGWLAAGATERLTFDLLLLLSLAGLAAGEILGALWRGRDLQGRPLSRRRCGLGAGAVLLAVSVGSAVLFGSAGVLAQARQYYAHETGLVGMPFAWWHPRALLAYPAHLVGRGIGPVLALPMAVAAGVWLWRGRGRWLLGMGVAVPLVFLSVLGKKNHYYVQGIYPLLPLVAALGVRVARPAWLGRVLAVWMIGFGVLQLAVRTAPQRLERGVLAALPWQWGDPTLGGLFQDPDGGLPLAPFPGECLERELPAALPRWLSRDPCRCPYRVWVQGRVDVPELALRLAATLPCAGVDARPGTETGVRVRIRRRPGPSAGPVEAWGGEGDRLADRRLCGARVALWMAPETWFEERCPSGGDAERTGADPGG